MTEEMSQASKIVRSACWAICTWLRSSRTSCRQPGNVYLSEEVGHGLQIAVRP